MFGLVQASASLVAMRNDLRRTKPVVNIFIWDRGGAIDSSLPTVEQEMMIEGSGKKGKGRGVPV